MDYTNKSLGLRVQTQIPLDVKKYIASEAALKDLGIGNNLAFTYIKGLIIYCILEGTRYEWKKIEVGDVGLLDDNFIYPDNIITFGIDYSNKEYNFVKIESIDPPLQKIDEGNGEGITIRGRNSSNFGNIGFSALDLSKSFSTSSIYGAKGQFSAILNGQNQEITSISEASIIGAGFKNKINAELSGIFSGSNNTIEGVGGGGGYFIGGGFGNIIEENSFIGSSIILAGNLGVVNSYYSTIINGDTNIITDTGVYGLIGAGNENIVSGYQGFIGQGFGNIASGTNSTIINGNSSEAKGNASIVLNGTNIADSFAEIVGGYFGTTYTPVSRTTFNIADRIFNIGIGISDVDRKDGISLFKNGIATLPECTISEIDAGSDKTIITKEYLEYQISANTNLQKIITGNYTLLSSDNNYSIKVNNGATPVTITVPTGLPENFFVGITQKGTADITFLGSGTTITNPIGLKIKGQGYCVGLEQIGTTNAYDLLADTKA